MEPSEAPNDVFAAVQRRWLLLAVAVGASVVTALLASLVIGDGGDVVVAVLLAAVAGAVLGLVAIWLAERFDTTIRRPAHLARLTTAPNLAVVPCPWVGIRHPDDVVMFRDPSSAEAEGYRSVRTGLDFVCAPAKPAEPVAAAPFGVDDPSWQTVRPVAARVVLVTSARPDEGRSVVAANLAASAAMAGRRVVVVDGDLRQPELHKLFRLKNEQGLSSMLTGEVRGFAAVQPLELMKRLVVLSAGPPPPEPAELLAGERLGQVLRSLAEKADLVVVNAPPLMAATDSTIIAQQCDGVVLVATVDLSDRGEWAEALQRLAVVDAEVLGTVLLRPDDHTGHFPTPYRYPPSQVAQTRWVSQAAEAFGSTDDDRPSEPQRPARGVNDGWPAPRIGD